MPGNEEWDNLQHIVANHKASMMIWEGQPSDEIKAKVKDIQLPYTVFNPCANKPDKGDFMDVRNQNVEWITALVDPY
jgi:zinc transport system substrate-binding protein